MSNYTLLRADRVTHVKIIAISFIACLLVVSVGFAARSPANGGPLSFEDGGMALKRGKPISLSSRESTTVR